jgi:hypothetical protein
MYILYLLSDPVRNHCPNQGTRTTFKHLNSTTAKGHTFTASSSFQPSIRQVTTLDQQLVKVHPWVWRVGEVGTVDAVEMTGVICALRLVDVL